MSNDAKQLGAFLVARRQALDPELCGIKTAGQRRRVAGLRREEVARRANISTDYYTRLEQGRVAPPSPNVLSALVDALNLDQAEEEYLREFLHRGVATRPSADSPQVPARMLRLIEDLGTLAALVISPIMRVLAWNQQAAALFLDFGSVPGPERNLARLIYLDDRVRERFVDWNEIGRACAAILRTGAARDPENHELAILLRELIAADLRFARAWEHQGVSRRPRSRSTYVHPDVGPMVLDWQLLTSVESPDHLIAAVSPGDRGASTDAFRALVRGQAQVRRQPGQ